MFLLASVNAANFCNNTKDIWRLVGNVLSIVRIVLIILIIIFGVIDLGKAVVSSDDGEIKKAAKQFGMRILAGICVFFVPNIVAMAFSLVDADAYEVCANCVKKANGC